MKNPINAMNVVPFDWKAIMDLDIQFFAAATANKIKFGLKNVHAFVVTDTGSAITYGEAKKINGGVTISLTPNGELTEFYADDVAYWSAEVNNGYDGQLDIADIPEWFATDILGDEIVDGVQYESSEQKGKKFALTFEINGDAHARRYLLYYCTATRPTIGSATKGATVEPQTSSLTFNTRPHPYNYLIKANTTAATTPEKFAAWNTKVHEKAAVLKS